VRKEWLARLLVLALVAGAIAIPALAWQASQAQGLLIRATLPESGGWLPGDLKAEVGKPLKLRLTSDDVVHGFGLGQSDQPHVDIHPGEVVEVTLNFDKPGRYTFFCTRWCSINHWRMRGVIEVTGPAKGTKAPVEPPLYVQLGLDIDAGHQANAVPELPPSAQRGSALNAPVPAAYASRTYYLSHSPAELWQALRAEPSLAAYSDQDLWDLAALTWSRQATPAELQAGQKLYAENCAACHGESGAGDGVYADELDLSDGHATTDEHTEPDEHATAEPAANEMSGEMTQAPTDFTQLEHSLAASPAHWQGKILRGGMGTGMPGWGPIFTEEQTWALVAHLWTFVFEY
jgi:mono/diheme cytochrome c family protein